MKFHDSSFRDPDGGIFCDKGQLYRWVSPAFFPDYEHLMHEGLYEALQAKKWLIPHAEVSNQWPEIDPEARVLKPHQIPFISYPYEWSFSQYQDAALLTLQVQALAMEHGMTLKDASAYNIQFYKGRPVFIDTLSFSTRIPAQPWVAYRQFCQHFLGPLALMAKTDLHMGDLMRIYLDGIPLQMIKSMLPWKSRFTKGLGIHIFLHARTASGSSVASPGKKASFSDAAFQGLIQSLESSVRNLRPKQQSTVWGTYYTTDILSQHYLETKQALIAEWLTVLQPTFSWDLGANEGTFSRLAAQYGPVIAYDSDPRAVEYNYLQVRENQQEHILPLRLDLTNPSPALGWVHTERSAWLERPLPELTFALALIHHLAIGNQVPLAKLADFFALLGPSLIIEFVPKEDPRVQTMLAQREDVFPDYHQQAFEATFQRHFQIEKQVQLGETDRILYLMKKRS